MDAPTSERPAERVAPAKVETEAHGNPQPPEGHVASECAGQLVQLIINQDHVAQNWLKFLLAIESALAIAFSFLHKFGGTTDPVARWLIPTVAILVAIGLGIVTVYERMYQTLYVAKYNALGEGRESRVFPSGHPQQVGLWKLSLSAVDVIVALFCALIAIGWVIFGALIG